MKEIKNSVILTAHEEHYSDGRVIGILLNVDLNKNMERIDSFPYIFRETEDGGMYIFFETIIGMNDYILYGDNKVKRAYMKEDKFDELYDSNNINNTFETYLEWTF